MKWIKTGVEKYCENETNATVLIGLTIRIYTAIYFNWNVVDVSIFWNATTCDT